jgi:hypothetical protein
LTEVDVADVVVIVHVEDTEESSSTELVVFEDLLHVRTEFGYRIFDFIFKRKETKHIFSSRRGIIIIILGMLLRMRYSCTWLDLLPIQESLLREISLVMDVVFFTRFANCSVIITIINIAFTEN